MLIVSELDGIEYFIERRCLYFTLWSVKCLKYSEFQTMWKEAIRGMF
jgi:hypothetical protein